MSRPKTKKLSHFRLLFDVKNTLEQIARETGKTQTQIIEEAVNLYAEQIVTNR